METFPSASLSCGPGFSLVKVPRFKTDVVSYGEQREQRIIRVPRHCVKYTFRTVWDFPSLADVQLIRNFFIARRGSLELFLLPEPGYGASGLRTVRFAEDELNLEYFAYLFYRFGQINFQEP